MKKGVLADPERALTIKQMRFVAALATGQSQRQAAITAGLSPDTIDRVAKNPRVRRELDALRANIREHATYDAEAAFEDLTSMISEARLANQHTAVSRFQEMRMKLLGLLTERILTTNLDIDLAAAVSLAEAKRIALTAPNSYLRLDSVIAPAEPTMPPASPNGEETK